MGWFSKKKKEPSLFEMTIAKNVSKVWGWPANWYTDVNMVPLKKSGVIGTKELEALEKNLLPVLDLGEALVPQKFEFDLRLEQQVKDEEFSLRIAFVEAFPQTEFWEMNGGLANSFATQPTAKGAEVGVARTRFFRDENGREYGYVSVNLGFFTWPFANDFVDLAGNSAESSSEFYQALSDVNTLTKKVRSPIALATFTGISEALALNVSKRDLAKGRSSFFPGSSSKITPSPKFRIHSDWLVGAIAGKDWDWAYMPQILEVGWTFEREALSNDSARLILSRGPGLAFELFTQGCSEGPDLMNHLFASPSSWGAGIKQGVVASGSLGEFKEQMDYNGSPNSLAYSIWLEALSDGRVSLSALEKLLKSDAANNSEEEGLIAKGNLALANLMSGQFKEAESLALEVLEKQPDNSEAVFILEALDSILNKLVHSQRCKTARALKSFEVYEAPVWLTNAVERLATRSELDKSHHSQPSEFIAKTVKQFAEFAKSIDKVEFINLRDPEDIRPWVAVSPSSQGRLSLMIGTEEAVTFAAYPWLTGYSDGPGVVEFEFPTSFFEDETASRKILEEVFDTYKDLELEIVPLGGNRPKITTLFPVAKKEVKKAVAPIAAAAAAGVAGATATTYTTRFFYASSSSEDSGQDSSSFDWF
jgi:hypothetical protein